MNIGPIVGILLAGGACDGADPAKGGFFAGLSGIASGCYEKRIDERERAVGERERTRDALEAERRDLEARSTAAASELDRLRQEHMELKRRIVRLNSDLAARRVQLDAGTRSTLQTVLASRPDETPAAAAVPADAARVESLRSAIEDARALVDKLSTL